MTAEIINSLTKKLFSIKQYPSGREDYLPIYLSEDKNKIEEIFREELGFVDCTDPIKGSNLEKYFNCDFRFNADLWITFGQPQYYFSVFAYFSIKDEFKKHHFVSGLEQILPLIYRENFFGTYSQYFIFEIKDNPILNIPHPELMGYIRSGMGWVKTNNSQLGIIEDYKDEIFRILNDKNIVKYPDPLLPESPSPQLNYQY